MSDQKSKKKSTSKEGNVKAKTAPKNIKITVDADDDIDIDLGYTAEYAPIDDWDTYDPQNETASTATGAEVNHLAKKQASTDDQQIEMHASGGESDHEEEDVTFRVTMDEKKMEEHLYGKDGKNKKKTKKTVDDRQAQYDLASVSSGEDDIDGIEQTVVRPFTRPSKPPRAPMHLDMDAPDIHDPEIRKRRLARAERFGTKDTEADLTIEPAKLEALHKELGVSLGENRVDRYRPDTLHVRGVHELHTYDIMRYFADCFPTKIEWIDDNSCNVCFRSDEWAANCLLQLTKTLQRVKPPSDPEEGELPSSSDEESKAKKSSSDEGEITDEDDEQNDEFGFRSVMRKDKATKQQKTNKPKKSKEEKPIVMNEDEMENSDTSNITKVDITKHNVPPGRWRVCFKPILGADLLLVRFANIRDVKEPGAQYRSDYYRKHGNPNYEDVPGLISASLQRRLAGDLRGKLERPDRTSWMRRDKIRPGLNVYDNEGKELEWDYEHDTRAFEDNKYNKRTAARLGKRKRTRDDDENEADQSSSDSETENKKRRQKAKGRPIRMGMRADKEEVKSKSSRRQSSTAEEDRWEHDFATTTEPEREPAAEVLSDRWTHDDRDLEPTRQPWDPPTLRKMRVTVPNEQAEEEPISSAGEMDAD